MKVYDNYKSTENEWLKEIPAHWNFLKLRAFGRLQTSSIDKKLVEGEELINLLNYTDVYNSKDKWLDSDIEFMKVTAKPEQIKNNSVKDGDVFFTPSSEIIEEIGFSAVAKQDLENTCYSYHLLRLRFNRFGKSKAIKSYRRFLFNNEFVLNQFSKGAKGTTRKILNLNEFKDAVVAVPTTDEQTQIVKYLDYKTGLIDDFIASRKKQIDLLKEQLHFKINEALTKGINENVNFKPTEIKYVPEIPEHWDIRKFKGLTTILTCGYASTPEYVEESEGVAFLSAQNCRPFRMDLSKYSFIKPELHKQLTRYKKPQRGDVLVTRVGAGIGEACIIDTDLEFSVYVSLTHIRPNKEILSEYIVYFFNTEYCYQLNHEGTVVGGGQGNLNVKNVERYRIPLPPIDEQKEIVAYLDNYRSETDELISKYRKQIELMQEYRTAIISQAVTGKIDVRVWQPKAKELQS